MNYQACAFCGMLVDRRGPTCPFCGQDPMASSTIPTSPSGSGPAVLSAGGAPSAEAAPARTRRSRVARLLVLGVPLGLAAAAGVWLLRDGDAYPAEWDPQVAPLAAFVSAERGLEFEHPVHVDFLTEEEFRSTIKGDGSVLTAEERVEIEQATAMLRALGVIESDVDLLGSSSDLREASVIGYYRHDDKRIRIRGRSLTPANEITLVHELTHALQDQHFDLAEIQERDSAAETTLLQALVEGDAERIASRYEEQLTEEERAEVASGEAEDEEARPQADDVPPILSALLAAPYSLGEPLVTLIVNTGDQATLDGALETLAPSDEHLIDPWRLVAREPARTVAAPILEPGEEELEYGVIGSLAWYFVLAHRIDPLLALDATDGWGGDHYVTFERGQTVCVRIRHQADTIEDALEMERAIEAWVATMPAGTASFSAEGGDLVLTSCDPGSLATAPQGDTSRLLALPVIRAQVAADLTEADDLPLAFIECYADGIVHGFPLDDLLSDLSDPQASATMEAIAQRCAAEPAN